MLGYVTVDKNELKVREWDVYQAYYCGVCKSISRRVGQLPRMVLSFDCVFLALILSSLDRQSEDICREHCIIHHLEKKPVVLGNQAVDYAADVMVILAYHKCLDDWRDERKPSALAVRTALTPAYRKIKGCRPQAAAAVEDGLGKLSALEKENCAMIDRVSGVFGEILAALFTGYRPEGPEDSGQTTPDGPRRPLMEKRTLEHLGRHLGRWIYLIDALDDYEEDQSAGTYNPLIFRRDGLVGMENLLYNELGEIAKAYDLLDIHKNKGILENIIFMGLRGQTDRILRERTKEHEQSI